MVTFNNYKSDFTEDTLEPYVYAGLIILSLWFILISLILIVLTQLKLRSLQKTAQSRIQQDDGVSSNSSN